jgi:hypothetical protein
MCTIIVRDSAASLGLPAQSLLPVLRSGKRGLSADFDSFAARFKALRTEYSPAPVSSLGSEGSGEMPSLVDAIPETRIESETSLDHNPAGNTVTPPAQAQTWEDVEIRFLSDERVQITIGEHIETKNYAEFGFEDARSEGPNRAWATLRALAESGGTVHRSQNGREGVKLEKRMQEIRSAFRQSY